MALATGEKVTIKLYTADGIQASKYTHIVPYSMSASELALQKAPYLPPGTYIRVALHDRNHSSYIFKVGRMAGEASVTGATLPTGSAGYSGFKKWTDVLVHVMGGKPIWYQAPMDLHPQQVSVRMGPKRNLMIEGRDFDPFMADKEHLSRFKKRTA